MEHTDFEITERVVYVYREIYYEHVKPLLKMGISDPELIQMFIQGPLDELGMTIEMFRALQIVDLMQRMSKYDNVKFAGLNIEPEALNSTLELKCPLRTEEDKFRNLYK